MFRSLPKVIEADELDGKSADDEHVVVDAVAAASTILVFTNHRAYAAFLGICGY